MRSKNKSISSELRSSSVLTMLFSTQPAPSTQRLKPKKNLLQKYFWVTQELAVSTNLPKKMDLGTINQMAQKKEPRVHRLQSR